MLTATRTFTASDGTRVIAGRTRIARNHPLAKLHPDCWRALTVAEVHPGRTREICSSGYRFSDDQGGPSVTLDEEIAIRENWLQKLNQRQEKRSLHLSERDRFWNASDAFVARHTPDEAPDTFIDVVERLNASRAPTPAVIEELAGMYYGRLDRGR